MTDILVSEVGPRDGLQSIKAIMPLEAKKRWIAAEAAAGVREIEVGQFVPPSLLPRWRQLPNWSPFGGGIAGLNGGSQLVTQWHKGSRPDAPRRRFQAMRFTFSMSEGPHSSQRSVAAKEFSPAMLPEIRRSGRRWRAAAFTSPLGLFVTPSAAP